MISVHLLSVQVVHLIENETAWLIFAVGRNKWCIGTHDWCTFTVKSKQDLTRFAIQAKGPDGKWARKPLAYRESNNVHLLISRPPEICVNLVFKHIHAASSYTICRQFVPFIYCPL